MKIIVNGEKMEMADGLTISGVLDVLGHATNTVAVAVNGTFVPRSQHGAETVKEGDAVELVAPRQGG